MFRYAFRRIKWYWLNNSYLNTAIVNAISKIFKLIVILKCQCD